LDKSLLDESVNSRHWLENLDWQALDLVTHFILRECWNCGEIGAFWIVRRSGGLLIEDFAGGCGPNRRAASSRELRL